MAINKVPFQKGISLPHFPKLYVTEDQCFEALFKWRFTAVTEEACQHDRIVCGGGKASVQELELYWVNTILGNLKSALRSTYHSIKPKHAQRYLSAFQYRFNRRYDLKAIPTRLAYVSLRTPPMPERLLRMA